MVCSELLFMQRQDEDSIWESGKASPWTLNKLLLCGHCCGLCRPHKDWVYLCQVEIAFDNKSAGDATDGRCQLAGCSRLSEPSRPDINVTTRHVHSHRGDPCNELVDIAAKVLTVFFPTTGR